MNTKNLTIAAAYALCFGFILIVLILQLPGAILPIIGGSGLLFRYWRIRRWKKAVDDAHKTNDTLFEERIALATSTVMVALGIGLTYILLNHVFDFQPHNFDCGANGIPRKSVSSFQCMERMVLTAIYSLTFLSLIAGMWLLARRVLVREHWDDL